MSNPVIWLSGTVRPELLGRRDVGLMLQPGMGNRLNLSRTPWAADNGCFAAGAGFRLQFFETMLESLDEYRSTCLFAVAPDVLGDPEATLARSLPVLPRLRAFGYAAAFVAQDGQESLPQPWDSFDVLFIGGTDAWKLTPQRAGYQRGFSEAVRWLVREARSRGKWAHIGRVNSLSRCRAVVRTDADSADGTYLRFGPDMNLPKLERWLSQLALERELPGLAATALAGTRP